MDAVFFLFPFGTPFPRIFDTLASLSPFALLSSDDNDSRRLPLITTCSVFVLLSVLLIVIAAYVLAVFLIVFAVCLCLLLGILLYSSLFLLSVFDVILFVLVSASCAC